jgi:hypothetical protein
MRGLAIRGCARGIVIDCRSRQAARGPSRPGAKSTWITGVGLASPRESAGGVKERRKPNRRWQSREIGGGFPQTGGSRERPSWEHSVERRRSGSGKSSSLTRGRRKRSWFLAKRPAKSRVASGGATGSVRGSIASSARGRQRQARVGPSDRRIPGTHQAERQGGAVCDSAEAGGVPSSMRPAGVGLPQGGLASHGRTRPSGRGRILRSAQRKLRARKSNDPRVLVS